MTADPSASLASDMSLALVSDRGREDADIDEVAAKALAGLGTRRLTEEQKQAKKVADAKLKARYDHDLNTCHRTFVEGGELQTLLGQMQRALIADDVMLARAILRETWTKGFRQGFNRGRLLTDLTL